MGSTAKLLVVVGCLLVAVALILRGVGFFNLAAMSFIKPSSILILANTSLLLALLFKK